MPVGGNPVEIELDGTAVVDVGVACPQILLHIRRTCMERGRRKEESERVRKEGLIEKKKKERERERKGGSGRKINIYIKRERETKKRERETKRESDECDVWKLCTSAIEEIESIE